MYDKGTAGFSNDKPIKFVNTELTKEEMDKEVEEFKKLQSQVGFRLLELKQESILQAIKN